MPTSNPVAIRRINRAVIIVVVIVVAGCLAIYAVHRYERPRTTIGTVQLLSPFAAQDTRAHAVTVTVPTEKAIFEVSGPRSDIPADWWSYPVSTSHLPPRHGSFVTVSVHADGEPPVLALTPSSFDPTPSVALVDPATSRRYPLRQLSQAISRGDRFLSPGLVPNTYLVSVAGHPDDLQLAVTYDGVTQTVAATPATTPVPTPATSGQASSIRVVDSPQLPARHGSCPVRVPATYLLDNRPNCQITSVTRVPYVQGLGWAPHGEDFVVLGVDLKHAGSVRISKVGQLGHHFMGVGLGALRARLGGRSARRVLMRWSDGIAPTHFGGPTTYLAFDVPTDSTTLPLHIRATGYANGAEKGPITIPFRWQAQVALNS